MKAFSIAVATAVLVASAGVSRAEDVFPALPAAPDVSEAIARDLAADAPRPSPDATVKADSPASPAGPAVAEATPQEKPADAPAVATSPVQAVPPAEGAAVAIALPELPDVVVSVEASSSVDPSSSAAASLANPSVANPSFTLPEMPEVVVAIAVPPTGPAALEIDEPKLRALVDARRVALKLKPQVTDGVVAFYLAREFKPLWLDVSKDGERLSVRAEAVRALMAKADEDGLNVARLLGVFPQSLVGKPVPAAERADAEIGVSLAAYLYAHDMRGGRLEPSKLSALMTPNLSIPAADDVLTRLAEGEAAAVVAALEAYQPQHAGYKALKKELARLREDLSKPMLTGSVAGAEGAPASVAPLPAGWLREGGPLKAGMNDSRVPLLRVRLGMPAGGADAFDKDVVAALREFQKANGQPANGVITPKTLALLEDSAAPQTRVDRKPVQSGMVGTLVANMERWRWLPTELGRTHIFVNVPEYQLRMVIDGAVTHRARVIVGRPDTQTPIFSDEMQFLVVNPSWYVPPSILKKEFLPKLASDPGYAARRGYEVIRGRGAVGVRQPPGPKNALGYVKFLFPNKHSVYLHDTPNRNLFQSESRAFSHGCIRVDQPFQLAEHVLGRRSEMSEASLKSMIGRGERQINLPQRIPVHLTYFTVSIDETGKLVERRDLYGHDVRVKRALAL